MEDSVKTSSIQTKITPSYLMQNVTCSSNGYLAYANISGGDSNSIVVIKLKPDGVNRESETVITQSNEILSELKYVLIKSEWKLVAVGYSGFRIYSEDGKTQHSNTKVNEVSTLGELKNTMSGVCLLQCSDGAETICVGSSSGCVYFAECLGSQKFQMYIGLNLQGGQKLNCLASCDNILATSGQEGDVQLFMANSLRDLTYIKKLESQSNKTPITSMSFLRRKNSNGNLLVCGDYLGQVLIYDLNEFCLLMKINSHIRVITQVDCNHATGEILSASEDSFVNLWKVDSKSSNVSLSFSLSINDLSIVGASFGNKDKSDSPIYLTCYEQEEIHIIQRKV